MWTPVYGRWLWETTRGCGVACALWRDGKTPMLSSTRIRARRATAVWIASSTMLRNTNLEGTDNVPGQNSDCKRDIASDRVLFTTVQPGLRPRKQLLQRCKGMMTVMIMTVHQFYKKFEVIWWINELLLSIYIVKLLFYLKRFNYGIILIKRLVKLIPGIYVLLWTVNLNPLESLLVLC